MAGINRNIFRVLIIPTILLMTGSCSRSLENGPVKILILSGRNNHEWQKTTPLLSGMYRETGLFSVNITELPDTLTFNDLRKFDVIVSNWNTWPDNNVRFPARWEKDFLRYIKKGGGAVFIHAGASSFYSWKDYHKIGIGRWGKNTRHGEQIRGRITGFDRNHPITNNFRDFLITDELWENTDIYPMSQPIAVVTAADPKDGHSIKENAAFVSVTGKGRSFFTILGHNERALLNSGLRTLLLRATQWTAQRNVTINPPAEINTEAENITSDLHWERSDTTQILKSGADKIWQFNFNNRFGKPYFHPLSINKSVLTCSSPPDHPWHLGYWFSWKFINGINYWEYLDNFKSEETGYKSAGITRLVSHNLISKEDFSCDMQLELDYYPDGSAPVLKETRQIHISPPMGDGSYYIDQESIFSPVADNVILDRTPISGEPDGKSWGGYAGLSIRFSQDYTSPLVIAPDSSDNYKKNDWVYMGFNTLGGDTAGVCIFKDAGWTTPETSWYVINNPEIPFFYFSPAILFKGKITLRKSTNLHLRYRTWILSGKVSKEKLAKKYEEYLKN